MACEPPMATTTSGRVMNGPTPIMFIMFSEMALPNPIFRSSAGWAESVNRIQGVCLDDQTISRVVAEWIWAQRAAQAAVWRCGVNEGESGLLVGAEFPVDVP